MEDSRKRYKCNCTCGNVFYATKSIFQTSFGINSGHGSCPKCKVFFHLAVDEENECMKLTEWSEHLKTLEV